MANGQNTYSEGLTWLTDYYPELTMREINALGGGRRHHKPTTTRARYG
jgi:hypothetical protein